MAAPVPLNDISCGVLRSMRSTAQMLEARPDATHVF